MKLLFCLECQDIVRLTPERRSCRCGRAWGYYLEDNQTTVQTRNSLSLALAGPDFDRAIRGLIDQPNVASPLLFIRAWFNALSEKDVRYVEPDSTNGDEDGAGQTQEPTGDG